MKIQHTLMSIKKTPQKQTHRTPQTLPAIYLTNELIFSDATLQRCEWKQTLHSHKMNDCFHSYSARIFFFCTKRKGLKKKKQTPQNLFLNINVKKIFLRKKKKKKNHNTSLCLGGNCILGFIVLVVYKTCYSF